MGPLLSQPEDWRTTGAITTMAVTLAASTWVVLWRGNLLIGLVPAVAIVATGAVLLNRQVAAYVMLASLPFAEVSLGHGVSLVRYVLLAVLVAWLVGASMFEPFVRLRPDKTDLKVLLWILGSIASAVFLDAQEAPGLAQTFLNLALVYYVASRMVRDERQARGAVLALCVGLGAVAVLTLASPHLADSISAASSATAGNVQRLSPLGATGTAGVNRFAGWLAVGAMLPWVAFRDSWKPSTLVARGLSVIIFTALVATVSKGGLIAFAAGLLCWVLVAPRTVRLRRAACALVVLSIGWFLLPGAVHQRFAAFSQANSDAYSRLAIWEAGLKMFIAHPLFGVGVGNYDQFSSMYFPQGTGYQEAQAAHNIIVGALAETGIAGTILLLTMIGAIVLEGFRMVRASHGASAAAGIFVGYLVFLTAALSVDLQQDRYFLVLAGLVHGSYQASLAGGPVHE
jgi:O-antigen ligase